MYEYDYERQNRKEEPKIELGPVEKTIEAVLLGMTGAALIFFFFKVMFF